MEIPIGQQANVGVKIEKPVSEQLGFLYQLLVIFSLAFIGFSLWVLASEYVGESMPVWFQSAFGHVAPAIQWLAEKARMI